MVPPHPIEPGELLAHAGWMRALAASLVHDSASADDVVQESMVAALRHPPLSDRPLEAWLSRVVRNVASRLRRNERRLSDRHARIDKGESTPDPLETLERLDTQHLIVQLVRELDEPSRSTIVLRYFEGLTSEEIGRRMHVSDATVRWRLQQALEQIRARLQREFGSRQAWCAVLGPLAYSSKVAGGAAVCSGAAAGVIVMGTASKFMIAGVLVAAVIGGTWIAREGPESSLPTAEAAPSKPEANRAELAEPVAPVTEARESVAVEAGSAAAKPAAKDAPAKAAPKIVAHAAAHLRARFVDSSGQPWDRVWFRGADSGKPTTTSGPDGKAALTLEDFARDGEQVFQFMASRDGCATRTMRATVAPGQALDLGELVLEREARIRGIVHDAKGTGLADVTVGLSAVDVKDRNPARLRRHGSSAFDHSLVAQSNSRGEFDLRGVPPGKWRLWGKGEERGYGVSEPFEVHPGEEQLGVDFEVPALLDTDWIGGKVVDPSGVGVEADLSFSYQLGNESGVSGSETDPDGSFKILLQLDVASDLVASDKQHRWADASIVDVAAGTHDLIVQLLDPSAQRHMRLRAHGPANEPVRELKVSTRSGKPNSYNENALTIQELEPGLYEFQIPMGAYGFSVTARDYLPSDLISVDPANPPAEKELEMALAPVLRGHVRAGGKAIAGATIEAKRALKKNSDMTFNGFRCLMTPHEQTKATSGENGTFQLALDSENAVYLRCTAPGFAATIVGPIEVSSATGMIEIELNQGGAIEGHVHAKDGTSVVGAIVGVTCGDGHPRTMRSGIDGLYRFEGLSAGRWIVSAPDEEFRTDYTSTSSTDQESPIVWSCEVSAGVTTFHDLQLEH